MDTNKLYLVFTTDQNKNYTLIIDTPIAGLTEVEVGAAMNEVLQNNIFSNKNGVPVSEKEAKYIERVTEEITLA